MVYTSPAGEVPNLFNGNAVQFMYESPYLPDHRDHVIYQDAITGESITVTQSLELIGRCHSVLASRYGIKYDDVVCTFFPNTIYMPIIQHGIFSLGGINTPANCQYTAEELAHQLRTTGAKLTVTVPQLLDTVVEADKLAGTQSQIIMASDLVSQMKSTITISKPVPVDGKSKHLLYCFSSGTSGVPKCVITSHQNMTSNVQQDYITNPNKDWAGDIAISGFLPMSHMYGLSVYTFRAIWKVNRIVVFDRFDFELLLKSIVKYKITHISAVPPIVLLFAKSPLVEKYPEVKDIVEFIGSGAAPLSKSLSDTATSRIKTAVVQGYGLTETSPTTHGASIDPENYRAGSIGWLVASCEARVVDEEGNDVKQGESGELWLRGPNIMLGYLHNEKATKESLTPDKWFKTGDIAIVDETEQFYIVDRSKELIKYKGLQVAPAELEAMLLEHENVADAAVTGVWNEAEATEMPRAFIVLNDRTRDPMEVKTWFDERVAKHKRLSGGIVLLEAIPKSPSGKILRRHLKKYQNEKVYGVRETAKL